MSRRATVARERAQFVENRVRDSHITGMNLQASRLTRAEAVPVSRLHLDWWQILGIALGVLGAASVCAWLVEVFDRPVYSDDEFARMTGAAKVRTTSV